MIGITQKIEHLKAATGMSYIDTFIDFCTERELDPEELIHQVNKTLKQKIADEFIELGMTKSGRPKFGDLDEWFT